MIMPNEFIHLAEESNLIIPMGLNLLEKACLQLSKWSKNPNLKHISIAVNVSAKQVWHKDFVESFSKIIKNKCINPGLLTIEITESIMVRDMSQTIKKLIELKKLGIKVSLDDFGTGFSSLSYLKRLPVDEIKIDASFVQDIVENALDLMMVKAILDLGLNFNVGVIAEGVESTEQMTCLQAMNMPYYQGFYFSKPLPVKDFEALETHQ
jgi:EAL domain-containing protein (putative c-di-GMP-specific phosphodiesterase class I)